ncbi:hypothetical protein NMG60_11024249 [Bertholletia excelsa]
MADLYGTSYSSSPESEDMSSILHNLIHNSFTSLPSSSTSFKDKQKQLASSPPAAAAAPTISSSSKNLFSRYPVFSYSDGRFREGTSSPGSSLMVGSSTGLNFSDQGSSFVADADECAKNMFSSIGSVDSDGITSTLKRKSSAENVLEDFGFHCKKGADVSEAPGNPVPPRSSKRNRAAEVHNLSEKRRRSRINEKMKALQNLIPNSSKTDKASMLDEAIEYLKQLQLQVQMLSMRNGLSLHPLSMLGSLHPTQPPQTGIGLDMGEELLNMKGDTFSGKQEMSMQVGFDFQNQRMASDQPNLMAPMVNMSNLETPFGLEPPIQNQYGPFNRLAPSKEICRENRLSQLQLDMNCSGKNSSSGVSS